MPSSAGVQARGLGGRLRGGCRETESLGYGGRQFVVLLAPPLLSWSRLHAGQGGSAASSHWHQGSRCRCIGTRVSWYH